MLTDFEFHVGLFLFGLVCFLGALPLISIRISKKIINWKRQNKWLAFIIDSWRGGGTLSDDELEVRGGFKVFTGILLLFLGAIFLLSAL
jgi:hypothetical protein